MLLGDPSNLNLQGPSSYEKFSFSILLCCIGQLMGFIDPLVVASVSAAERQTTFVILNLHWYHCVWDLKFSWKKVSEFGWSPLQGEHIRAWVELVEPSTMPYIIVWKNWWTRNEYVYFATQVKVGNQLEEPSSLLLHSPSNNVVIHKSNWIFRSFLSKIRC